VQGKTAVCVAVNSTIVGIIGIADVAKPEAYGAIKALRAMNIDVWMLTGILHLYFFILAYYSIVFNFCRRQ